MRDSSLTALILSTLALFNLGCDSDDYAERMAEEHKDDAPVASPAAEAEPAAAVEAARVSYARVGSIGWCFGGGWSLQTALALPRYPNQGSLPGRDARGSGALLRHPRFRTHQLAQR